MMWHLSKGVMNCLLMLINTDVIIRIRAGNMLYKITTFKLTFTALGEDSTASDTPDAGLNFS